MKRAIIIFASVVVVFGVIGFGWWYVNENPEWWFWAKGEFDRAADGLGLGPEEEPLGVAASGYIEAEKVSMTTELGGRIAALHADEGDAITAGQVLVELDGALLQSRIEIAQADLAVAEATLAQVKAGARPETLDYAQAMVTQARVAQDASLVGWQDARTMLENPQELDLAITAARAQLGVLDYQVAQAQAMANSGQVGSDLAAEAVQMFEDLDGSTVRFLVAPGVVFTKKIRLPVDLLPTARHEQAVATYQSWQAWTGLEQAEVARNGADAYVAELSRQKANPLTLQAQVNAAKSQHEIAAAAVDMAQAQVDGLQIGATPEQIAAVEAQVEIARSALHALEVQKDKLTLRAPISGLVLERLVHAGEVAVPGAPLITLADLDDATLTVYVPEDQLGKVHLGQPVSVMVDAYPDRTFTGAVAFIAGQAEFTPKNVQTREERVNMVFAVKVKLPNEDHALKPGMPADAVLQIEDE